MLRPRTARQLAGVLWGGLKGGMSKFWEHHAGHVGRVPTLDPCPQAVHNDGKLQTHPQIPWHAQTAGKKQVRQERRAGNPQVAGSGRVTASLRPKAGQEAGHVACQRNSRPRAEHVQRPRGSSGESPRVSKQRTGAEGESGVEAGGEGLNVRHFGGPDRGARFLLNATGSFGNSEACFRRHCPPQRRLRAERAPAGTRGWQEAADMRGWGTREAAGVSAFKRVEGRWDAWGQGGCSPTHPTWGPQEGEPTSLPLPSPCGAPVRSRGICGCSSHNGHQVARGPQRCCD